MKKTISKYNKYLILLFFVFIALFIGSLCLFGNRTSSIVLCGLINNEEAEEVAFNYECNRTIILSDGSMAIQIPNGWRANNDDTTKGVIFYTDGTSHIQILSLELSDTTTPDSVIKQLVFSNQSEGRVFYTIISENSISINRTAGKRIEISGSDSTGQRLHGLVTVLIEKNKCYIVSCITKESDFDSLKDTFIELDNQIILN